MSTLLDGRGAPPNVDESTAPPAQQRVRFVLAVYALSRVVCLAVALVALLFNHYSLGQELHHWDGKWYVALAEHGYPHTIPHHLGQYSTLGFFPLFSLLMWPVEHVLRCGYITAGVLLSLLFGGGATVLIHRLARGWWGEDGAKRAIVLFCFFPGTIVFSMVYTEGLLLALVAGMLLALRRHRWVTAGVLAGLATAVEPVGLVAIPVCVVAALAELWRHGWRDPEARRALIAPLLSPAGVIAFGAFLWAWVGTPFATLLAQRYAWGEHSGPLALYYLGHALWEEIKLIGHPAPHKAIDLNDISGLVGAVLLAYGLILLWRHRPRVSLAAAVWTLGVAFLATTSGQTPPNPRLLLCAFPVVLVLGARFTRWTYRLVLGSSTLLLLVMSFLTFVSKSSLRP